MENCVFYNVYCFWNLPADCHERYCFGKYFWKQIAKFLKQEYITWFESSQYGVSISTFVTHTIYLNRYTLHKYYYICCILKQNFICSFAWLQLPFFCLLFLFIYLFIYFILQFLRFCFVSILYLAKLCFRTSHTCIVEKYYWSIKKSMLKQLQMNDLW